MALSRRAAVCISHLTSSTRLLGILRNESTSPAERPRNEASNTPELTDRSGTAHKLKLSQKSMAEADEEMRKAMEKLAGDGGEAGVELEHGKPVAMKRSVRENMFRYI